MTNLTASNYPNNIETLTQEVLQASERLVTLLKRRSLHIVAVESCTGGTLAGMITSIPGSSEILRDSFVTYSNESKIALGVPDSVIGEYGVYSAETAVAMAQAGLQASIGADISIGIGIGITGSLSRVDPANSASSLPGQVYIGIVHDSRVVTKELRVDEPIRYYAKLALIRLAICEVEKFFETNR